MRKLATLILMIPLGGCGPQPGDAYVTKSVVPLYVNDEAFQRHVDHDRAGVPAPEDDYASDVWNKRLVYLHDRDLFRVVEAVPGGVKVAVESGESKGVIGKIPSLSFRRARPR